MAEKITASWFNKIKQEIIRLKNMFGFTISEMPNDVPIYNEDGSIQPYSASEFKKINAIIQTMAQDAYLKYTNNDIHPSEPIYYTTVTVGKRGEKPLSTWKAEVDKVVNSWQYITCKHGTSKTNGKNSVSCSYGSNSNGTCSKGYKSYGPVTDTRGTCKKGGAKNTNLGCTPHDLVYSNGSNSVTTRKNGQGSYSNGACSYGTNSDGSYSNTCSDGTCTQGTTIDIRYKKTTEG